MGSRERRMSFDEFERGWRTECKTSRQDRRAGQRGEKLLVRCPGRIYYNKTCNETTT